jgi:hypothetical protein
MADSEHFSERIDGPTPGGYTLVVYNAARKEDATEGMALEFDEHGEMVAEHWLRRSEPESDDARRP